MLIQHLTERYYDMAKPKITGLAKPPKNVCENPLINKVHKNYKLQKLIVVDPSGRFLRTHKKG